MINEVIEKYGLNVTEASELSEYTANRFSGAEAPEDDGTDYMKGWLSLAHTAQEVGAAQIINAKLCPKRPIDYFSPEGVRLEIFASFAGDIPIISADDPRDFESLVTNIVNRGIRPEGIEKTGASFVSGRTTRFIILSAKPYSNVPASELGLSPDVWAEKSLHIRRSHECTHLYTKQTRGISENRLHDELMADFIGLNDAFGFYRAEWFLRFMGIIGGSGSRLDVYTKGLSPKVRTAVTELAEQAAYGLEKWSQSEGFASLTNAQRIERMCDAGITGMIGLKEE